MNTALQITMSRVPNYGSLLQTYALQEAINSVDGWECKTLDYSAFPPKCNSKKSFLRRALDCYLYWRYLRRRELGFESFRKRHISFTKDYPTAQSIREDPPRADVYITGADQTFNPNHIGKDGTWFLDFVPQQWRAKVRKISYASSFAASEVAPEYERLYRPWLQNYDALSLREQSGVDLVRKMLNRDAALCCDPTLMLSAGLWRKLAEEAKWKIRKPYILVYNLAYMVNPYPQAEVLEREVQERLNLPVIYLCGRKRDAFRPNSHLIRESTPEEFLYLFFNAEFVITTSFHGTVFSLHAKVPFISLAECNARIDTRLKALLTKCHAEKHLIEVPIDTHRSIGDINEFRVTDSETTALRDFADESFAWLKHELSAVGGLK